MYDVPCQVQAQAQSAAALQRSRIRHEELVRGRELGLTGKTTEAKSEKATTTR